MRLPLRSNVRTSFFSQLILEFHVHVELLGSKAKRFVFDPNDYVFVFEPIPFCRFSFDSTCVNPPHFKRIATFVEAQFF